MKPVKIKLSNKRIRRECWKILFKEFKSHGLIVTKFMKSVINPKRKEKQTEALIFKESNEEYLLLLYQEKLLSKYEKMLEKSKFKWTIELK